MSVNYDIFKALGPAVELHKTGVGEEAARAGCNRTLTVISQLVESLLLVDQVGLHTPLPIQATLLAVFLAPTIGIYEYIVDDDSIYKKPLRWAYDHFGQIIQVASLVNVFALYHFGFVTYAVVSATFLAYGFLEKHHLLPLKVREVYATVLPWFNLTSLVINGGLLIQIIGAIELTSKMVQIAKKIPATRIYANLFPPRRVERVPLTYAQFQAIQSGHLRFEVNRSHIEASPFPQVAERDFTKILDLWDTFDWNEPVLFATLRSHITRDARWKRSSEYSDYIRADAEGQKQAMIAYARSQLRALLRSIERHSINTGQPLNYQPLENFLGVVAQELPKRDPERQQEVLFLLSTQGGEYCGPGITTQTMIAATRSLGGDTQISFKDKILILLEQERFKIVEAYHLLLPKLHPFFYAWVGGTADVHGMNYMIRLIAEDFHVPDTGALGDEVTPLHFTEKWIYRKMFGINPECLWRHADIKTMNRNEDEWILEHVVGYVPERIKEAVLFSPNTLPILVNEQYYEWARAWIERPETGATASEKAAFLRELTKGTFNLGSDVRDTFLEAVLVDMDILRVV